jgi:hypothetical protein
MIAFLLGIFLMALYVAIKSQKDDIHFIDVLGISALLCVVWGVSRYKGTTPKPLWDPN